MIDKDKRNFGFFMRGGDDFDYESVSDQSFEALMTASSARLMAGLQTEYWPV